MSKDFKGSLAIILAAGEGTRMRSLTPKVLHPLGGRPLVAHVIEAVRQAGVEGLAVVVGPGHAAVEREVQCAAPQAEVFEQRERRGTADAVLSAEAAIARGWGAVVVVFGDTPLVQPETLTRLREAVRQGAAVAVLGFRPKNPAGYGRLIMQGENLVAIREDKDATPEERRIGLCNAGLMAFAGDTALKILRQIGNANAKGEYYLTDAVEIAGRMGLRATVLEAGEDEVRGINTKAQLAEAEAVLQQRLRAAALEAGVTMIAPETVFLSKDTKFGSEVVVEPYVIFGPGVEVGDDVIIHSFSHLEGAHIGKGASVGPFARLRPGTRLGEKSRIGNFVETKAVEIEAGAKANHLAYLGDGRVGENANIGAGTIFCNYDGVAKHRTDVGKGVFVGSNSALVAPVTIGDGAYVGTGSVITDDVPADALAIARGRQVVKAGRAKRLKEKRKAAPKTPAAAE